MGKGEGTKDCRRERDKWVRGGGLGNAGRKRTGGIAESEKGMRKRKCKKDGGLGYRKMTEKRGRKVYITRENRKE